MELSIRTARIAAGVTLAIAAALVLAGIWSFGIWDPWELTSADVARRLAAGEAPTDEGALQVAPLAPWLVAQGFSIFGIHEWSGRVPIALAGLSAVGLAYWLVARFAGARAGVYAALITATSPLFLFNARQMIGAAPGFAAQALVFLCAASLAFQPEHPERPGLRGPAARVAWAMGLGVAIALATMASGILMGVLPPLGAVIAVSIARGELAPQGLAKDRGRAILAWALALATVALAVRVALVVAANAEGYSAWIGGAPRGGSPPTFEIVLEQVFHSFAPWSALLPIALGRALAGRAETDDRAVAPAGRSEEPALRLALALWAIFGFCAQTVFVSRFGTATFLPIVALAGSVALLLRDVERSGRGSWAAGVVALLLSVLLLRDFRGYPAVPASGLGIEGLSLPDDFPRSSGWAVVLGLFGLLAMLGLSVDREDRWGAAAAAAGGRGADAGPGPDPERAGAGADPGPERAARRPGIVGVLLVDAVRPLRLLHTQWERGFWFRAWMVVIVLVLASCTVFGLECLVFGDERPYAALQTIALVSVGIAAVAWLTLLGVGLASLGVGASRLGRGALATVTAGGLLLGRWAAARGRLPAVALSLVGLAVVATASAISNGILGVEAISSLAVRIGRVLTLIVPGIALAVVLVRAVRLGFHTLGQWALVPMLAAGLAAGVYTIARYQPTLSSHFSPREVYDAYNRLAREGEALGEYRVGGRAAAYYARGEVRELREQNEALDFLVESDERVWLAFRADDLAALDRAYRQRANRHLFVADASSTSVLLATNQPIEGRESENYLADAILDEVPRVQHHVGANFDQRVELVGYDLDLPGGHTVGPGQQFVVTWYWRVMSPVPGSYQIFLHVDGQGQRLNGDHEPVEGHYPVRLWDEGDIVVDRQTMRVPANFPPGQYTFFIGFYAGENRLEIVSGPEDDVNRARAGTLVVR